MFSVGVSEVLCSASQGREGEIRHLFRGFAFLHCKKLVENGGMFVCKTRHLVLAGGSKVGLSHWLLTTEVACYWLVVKHMVFFMSSPAQRCDQFPRGGIRTYEPSYQQPHAPWRRG